MRMYVILVILALLLLSLSFLAAHLVSVRRTLRCGLDVILHPDSSVPQVCVNLWYRVGSSDETPGRTGFAHLFEHLFKNSEHMPSHHYDVLRRAGASEANASTGTDRTAYHEIVPANELFPRKAKAPAALPLKALPLSKTLPLALKMMEVPESTANAPVAWLATARSKRIVPASE